MNKNDLKRFIQQVAAGEIVIFAEDDTMLIAYHRDAPDLALLFAKRHGYLDKVGEATRAGALLWCKKHKAPHLLAWQDLDLFEERKLARLNIFCVDGAPTLQVATPDEKIPGKVHFIQAIVRSDGPIVQND